MMAGKNMELARERHPEAFKDAPAGMMFMSSAAEDPKNQIGASVFPEVMEYTLNAIRELGGFETYLDSIGFTAADRNALRALVVEEDYTSDLVPQPLLRALVVDQIENGKNRWEVREMSLEDLPEGDVTVAVEASTMNYKDGLAMQPNGGGVIQKYPMVPGIDLSGTVSESSDPRFQKGDRVVLNGYGASETKWGGYSSVWRGSGKDLVKIPANLSTEQAMMIGTGGYTSMLCVLALEKGGVTPESDGEILV